MYREMKKIGIVSPFNPYEVRNFLYRDGKSILNNNVAASSVHALVQGLLKIGNEVIVFTYDISIDENISYHGENLDIYVCSTKLLKVRFPGMGLLIRTYMGKILSKQISKHINEISVLHAQWTYDYAASCIPYVDIVPTFCTIRDWCPYILSTMKDVKSNLFWKISSCVFKKVINNKRIKFIANSYYTEKCFYEMKKDCHIPIIYNPIKEDFLLSERTSYPAVHTFVSVANNILEERKNIESLLVAFQMYLQDYPDSRLNLVGGYSENGIEIYRRKGLLRNVVLFGSLNHEEISEVLDASSVLVHPSVEETFGNILLEGMARRLPVIGGNNSGAVPFVLGEGKYGYLCDVKSPESIWKAMKKIMTDTDFRISLIENSYQYLKNNYLDITIAQKHIELYNSYLVTK